MKGGRRLAAAAAALLLVAPVSASASSDARAQTQYVTYSEEVPCPPSAPRGVVHRARPRRPHKRRIPHLQHRKVVRHAIVRRPRRRPLVRARQPVHSKRCSVLRRDRLTPASFGLTPESALLTPVDDEVQPGGPALVQPSSGRAAFGDAPNPATGGAGAPGGGGGGQLVSAAPEPSTWLLMMLGVGAVGWALRRRPGVYVS